MTRPMPSPNGTNHAGLFLPSGSRAAVAYDAAPEEPMDYSALVAFLADKLDDGDLAKVKRMLGLDDGSKAEVSGASDAARRGQSGVRPHAIKGTIYASDAFPNRNRLKV